jgi:hypothetical protein
LGLAAVRDLRLARAPVTAEDLAALETDVLAGFVLARAAAGLADGTIASDLGCSGCPWVGFCGGGRGGVFIWRPPPAHRDHQARSDLPSSTGMDSGLTCPVCPSTRTK